MGIKIIAKNKRASYDYFLHEKFEAGMVLQGTEVKSLRQGKANVADAHVIIDGRGEVWAQNIQIPQYAFGNIANHMESRKRKLLLKKSEIEHLQYIMKSERLTLIPTMIYFRDSLIKLEIALAKGKKNYDKRHVEAKKDAMKKIRTDME